MCDACAHGVIPDDLEPEELESLADLEASVDEDRVQQDGER